MARIIPNANTWIGWLPLENVPDPDNFDKCAPTEEDVAAAYDLSCYTMSINASSTGNTVPTPSLCSLFETTINGTVSSTFQAEFYRDNAVDERYPELCHDPAWTALPRGVCGYFIIKWYGVEVDQCSYEQAELTEAAPPVCGDAVQVWPVKVTSRTASALSSGTVMTFSVTGAVYEVPCEDAWMCGQEADCGDAASGGTPDAGTPGNTVGVPRNVTASVNSDSTASIVYGAPEGNPSVDSYVIKASRDGGAYAQIGETSFLSFRTEALDAGTYTFTVQGKQGTEVGATSDPSNEVTVA